MPEGTTGYLFGIFDLFHIAHLDTIRLAADSCDRLIVGVATDDLVEHTCGLRPFVPSIERVEIIGAIRMITEVRPLADLDLDAELAATGADRVMVPGEELDVVQLAILERMSTPLHQLPIGRRTTSAQVRTALAGTTIRSSVA
jgi:glycerol-3-phosphate cytidylyltransferase